MSSRWGTAWRDRQPAVVLAVLYLSGATLVLAGLLLAAWPDAERTALGTIVGAAYVAGAALATLLWRRALPVWAAHGLVAAGGLLISAGVYFAGAQGAPVIAVFYIYVSAYAFFYFPTDHATAHTAFAAAHYALALWQLQPPSAAAQWVVITGAAGVAGAMVGGLGAASRDRAETEHEAAEQLRTAEQVRTALLRAAGHDLRTPLAAIAGFTETLLRDELTDEQRARILHRMRANTDRIQHLLDDLLDLDRIESGHKTLHTSDIALHRLIQTVAGDADLDNHPLRLDLQPVTVQADRVMLERVLDNLLGNATKYAPPDTTITIRLRPTDDAGAHLTIQDQGPGISPDLQPRLFDPFVRGPHDYTGTGIGLYLVKQFIDLHGGTVTADNIEPTGSVFRVHLPAAPPA